MANLDKLTNVSEVNQLILLGKEQGYLTYEEVNDILPSNLVTPDYWTWEGYGHNWLQRLRKTYPATRDAKSEVTRSTPRAIMRPRAPG